MKKPFKWICGIIAAGMVIFLLVKYGDRIPPEVWDAMGDAAETMSETISSIDTD